MEHKLLFFFTLLCVYGMVDFAKASIINQSIQTGQKDPCADIIGSNWNLAKQGKSPCPTLDVWVPKKTGFSEFVKVNEHNEVEGGFSIAVFCYAIQLLPFNVQPIFKPFVNERGMMNGSIDQLLQHIEGRHCTAVAGAVTIRANRTKHVSFTSPYISEEIYMLVNAEQEWNQSTLGTFIKPFAPLLWITLVCASILTGFTVAFLEYRASNHKFAGPFYEQLIMAMWFPISTFFFHEGKIHNKCSKVVLVMWLCMIFLLLQIYTATLSSWLTLNQLRPRLPTNWDKVGYQTGSFIKDQMIQKYNCSEKDLVPLNSYEEFKSALDNGSVNVVIDQLPYIDIFLDRYKFGYMKVGPIQQEIGIAFALPIGSKLLEIFSKAVINITQTEIMTKMKYDYLKISPTSIKQQLHQAHPQSLDVQSFTGLLIFMAIVTISVIIISEFSLIRRDNKIGIEEECKEKPTTSELVHIKILD
ncbi:hypothetical protein E3N88_28463 [Mikania micrantha]|uniref:Ionotropic glutamate receptor C-terminal domain-containing protein n=1 Tax=Mikania micrantha TaxID=192012 RepID=A0A5N6N2J2_9ASTR|nr:hypothetical protein E3N88_28463 [Mikania micrantha]